MPTHSRKQTCHSVTGAGNVALALIHGVAAANRRRQPFEPRKLLGTLKESGITLGQGIEIGAGSGPIELHGMVGVIGAILVEVEQARHPTQAVVERDSLDLKFL